MLSTTIRVNDFNGNLSLSVFLQETLEMFYFQLIIFGQNNQALMSFMHDRVKGLERILLENSSVIYTKQAIYAEIRHIRYQVLYVQFSGSQPGYRLQY